MFALLEDQPPACQQVGRGRGKWGLRVNKFEPSYWGGVVNQVNKFEQVTWGLPVNRQNGRQREMSENINFLQITHVAGKALQAGHN